MSQSAESVVYYVIFKINPRNFTISIKNFFILKIELILKDYSLSPFSNFMVFWALNPSSLLIFFIFNSLSKFYENLNLSKLKSNARYFISNQSLQAQ